MIVTYDFSEPARAAWFTAADLARRLDAKLHLVHVVSPLRTTATYTDAAPTAFDLRTARAATEKTLDAITFGAQAAPGRVTSRVVVGASVPATICETASELDADLIVMGSGAKGSFAQWLLGGVTEKTLRAAPCPVLTVPPALCAVIDAAQESAH